MAVFWDTAPCSLVEIDWHFRGVYCLHHQGHFQFLNLKPATTASFPIHHSQLPRLFWITSLLNNVIRYIVGLRSILILFSHLSLGPQSGLLLIFLTKILYILLTSLFVCYMSQPLQYTYICTCNNYISCDYLFSCTCQGTGKFGTVHSDLRHSELSETSERYVLDSACNLRRVYADLTHTWFIPCSLYFSSCSVSWNNTIYQTKHTWSLSMSQTRGKLMFLPL
jgi:hypothetical protein